MPAQQFSFATQAERHPVLVFVALTFAITWTVWFCVPWVAGTDWALGKIVTGWAFGPALAAIIMDRWRGTGATIGTRVWWMRFAPVFAIVAVIDVSILLTGDGVSADKFAVAQPPGLSTVGIVSALIAATVAGFIVATVAGSRSSQLSSLLQWRVPLRWWLAALLLPPGWMLLGLVIASATDSPIESITGGLPLPAWILFVLRSILFKPRLSHADDCSKKPRNRGAFCCRASEPDPDVGVPGRRTAACRPASPHHASVS